MRKFPPFFLKTASKKSSWQDPTVIEQVFYPNLASHSSVSKIVIEKKSWSRLCGSGLQRDQGLVTRLICHHCH